MHTSSYFPEPGSHDQEKSAVAMRDAQVFMALVSDAYANDKRCLDTFMYARLTLRKTLLLVVVGQGQEWQKSKIGILVTDQVATHWLLAVCGNFAYMQYNISFAVFVILDDGICFGLSSFAKIRYCRQMLG